MATSGSSVLWRLRFESAHLIGIVLFSQGNPIAVNSLRQLCNNPGERLYSLRLNACTDVSDESFKLSQRMLPDRLPALCKVDAKYSLIIFVEFKIEIAFFMKRRKDGLRVLVRAPRFARHISKRRQLLK